MNRATENSQKSVSGLHFLFLIRDGKVRRPMNLIRLQSIPTAMMQLKAGTYKY